MISVTAILADFPSSPMIVTISADITASDDPTCSDEEKAALKEAEADVDAGLASIEADLEEFEDLVAGN